MDLDQWTSLEPSAFRQQLLENRHSLDGISLVELYNSLIQKVKGDPTRVAKLAETAVDVFDSVGEADEALLFLELHARSHLGNDDIDQAMSIIARIIALNN